MKKAIGLLFLLPTIAFGQSTYVPDNNFEAYLEINGMGNGIMYDDSVTTANISNVTYLDVSGGAGTAVGIFDLTGIEDFTALSILECGYNQLNSLDVSNNTALTELSCFSNQLTSLDISNNPGLLYLFCHDNQLNCLNLKNGNNISLGLFAASNPNLTCIEVDDSAWSTANWTVVSGHIDTTASFSEGCNYPLGCFPIHLDIEEPPTQPKALLYITDVLGRTTYPVPNQVLFYLYEDGSVEKKIQLER